jgi:uncharacterized protein YfaS (alpha-2-macroglobulin family)
MGLVAAALWSAAAWAGDGALQVRRISPSGTDVQPGQELTIQFDRKMVPLGKMSRDTASLPVTITPDPGCQWRWLNTSELACRLAEKHTFAPATHYTVTVGTELKALDGSHLAKPDQSDFTTRLPHVDRARFRHWLSPTTPEFRVRVNMRVTKEQLARRMGFRDQKGNWFPVRIEPWEKKRRGPLWLPVPGVPGAIVEVINPKPDTPLDAEAKASEGRRVWKVIAKKPLAPDTHYELRVKAGLRSPLGTLAGDEAYRVSAVDTYGAFAFRGIACDSPHRTKRVKIAPGTTQAPRCRPETIRLRFSAPATREALAKIQWQPMPMTAGKLARVWKNYPRWYLRERTYPYDGSSPDSYPLTFVLEPMTEYTLTVPAGATDRFGRKLDAPETVTFRTGHRTPFLDLPPSEAVLEAGQPTIAPIRFTNLSRFHAHYRRLFAKDLAAQPRGAAGIFSPVTQRRFLSPLASLAVRGIVVLATRLDAAFGTSHASDRSKGPAPAQSIAAPAWPAHTLSILQRPDLDVREDHIARGALGIRGMLDGRSGVVWGTLQWAPHRYRPRSFLGEVTPWQVMTKVGHYNTLVRVSRLDDGKPVAGAHVRLALDHDSKLAAATVIGQAVRTDADGVAMLPGTVDFPDAWFHAYDAHASFHVGVNKDRDMALLPLNYTFKRSIGAASHYDVHSQAGPPHGHMRVWAVTAQGIYKPGSDVRYAAFVRAEGDTTLQAPPALEYSLTLTDPQGNDVLERKKVKLAAYGELDGTWHIPANAPMGWYDIHISWPTSTGRVARLAGRFLVTDFVPASFKVRTQVKGKRFVPGDTVAMRVHATLHAGGPYTDAKTTFTTRLVPARFSPDTPVAAGFSFGDYRHREHAKTLATQHTTLDHSGHAASEVTLPDKTDVIHGVVKIEGSVESARGTQVADDARVPFNSRDRFVGLRTRDWMQQAGKPFKVEYLVVDTAGKPASGSKIELVLKRRKITRVKVKNGAGEFTDKEKITWVKADHCQGVSKKAPGHCELTPAEPGRYRVLGHVVDTHGRTQTSVISTWVTGAGRVLWSHKGEGVTLVPDKSSYRVGDVAHVLVQNPYPGARALITLERYGVLWKKTVTLAGSAPVVDVPVTAADFPGAYLSVSIFSPRVSPPADPDLGKPQMALGYIPLKVTGKGSALDVAVEPARDTYKPAQTVDVKVAVRDHADKAAGKMRLVVAVVDQAVLDLLQKGTDYYDPRQRFYAPPSGPDIANYSLVNQLLTRLQPKAGKGENPGGGGGPSTGPNVRSHFSHAAYWNPDLETDAAGHAQFHFELPDNLTRWRILVIAMRPGAAMGLGDGSVRVNLPLQIKPALPTHMHTGDHFGAAFNVTNRTDGALSVSTHIQASGAIVGDNKAAQSTLALASFAHDLSWLTLQADAPGNIDLTATATAGKLGDGVKAHIPVTDAGTEVAAGEYGSTTGAGAHVPIKVPPKAVAGRTRVTATLAPTLVGGLDGAFDVMRDDPLRFWEARLSRGILASDYLRLKPVLGDAVDWPDAGDVVDQTLKAAANFQASDGGMAFWIPRDKFVSKYLSVYTALVFDWLDEAGHAPPARVREKLQGYLHKEILAAGADKPGERVLRAGAMAALAQSATGKLPRGAVAGMLPKLHKLRLFGQALLLQAAIASGDRSSADTIAKSLLSYAEESAGEISFNEKEEGVYMELLATPLRSNCAILDALSRYKAAWGAENLVGTTPQKLMRWVAARRQDDGSWPNSQENVFCTSAITHYADAYEPSVSGLTGTLVLPGHKPQSTTFSSRAAPVAHLAAPGGKPGATLPVTIERQGKGRLYYGVRVHYTLPPDAVTAADAGMTLQRHYYIQRGNAWKEVDADTELERGDIVRVDLIVDTPTARHHVVLSDPLPGAFEAVNRQLATAAKMLPAQTDGQSVLMFTGGPWPNMSITTGGFYHRETTFAAVRFFADHLPAGHYRLVYTAQVVAPGTFVAPAPTVKEIYQPDVFGRGTAAHLNVAMPGH